MKRIRLLALALLLCLAFPCGMAWAQQPLVIGVDNKDWHGHYEWKGDILLGVDADIVRAVAARLGHDVEFRGLPWKRVMLMAEQLELDGVLDLAPVKARQRFLHFVWTPVTTEGTAFWVKKGNSFEFNGTFTPEMRVGLMFGADWSDRFARQGMPSVRRFNNYKTAFSNLVAGRLDMFASHAAPTRYFAAKQGVLDEIEMLDLKYEGLPYYLAFTFKERYAELAERFARELKVFYGSVEYRDLLRKHDAMDLVGGYLKNLE